MSKEDSSSFSGKMLFANKLLHESYAPWKEYYLNYTHLKKLLKEGVILKNNWTDKDEQNFVSALDQDLEKVYTFQHQKYDELNESLNELQAQTELPNQKFDKDSFSTKLDEVLTVAQELEHFQRLNYTGFIKIVKKHDRIHSNYSVKPLLNVRLRSLPFHSEDYSPLLYKIGTLFQFLRENYGIDQSLSKLSSFTEAATNNAEFQSFKFWIHPDNLMEVKTTILRHLPVLIYNNKNSDTIDDDDDDEDESDTVNSNDQTINALYFDNDHFELYNNKLTKINNSSTLRIKWINKLLDKPKIYLEKKQFDANSNFNIDDRIELRQKYINDFVINKKVANKLKKINDESSLQHVLDFISEFNLQPALRTTYRRTTFQIPGDDKAKIVIDSNLTFIREDAFDPQLPIRDPASWHRTDIDTKGSAPSQFLRKGEFSKFPYATMEIKVKKSAVKNFKNLNWIHELINSHLVKEIPNFSKFIHGVASLFLEDDKLDNVPLWFTELETDLAFNPDAFLNKQPKKINDDGIQNDLTDEDNLSKFKSMILNNSSHFQPRSASFSGSILLNVNNKENEHISETITEVDEETPLVVDDATGSNVTTGQQLLTDDQSSDFDDDDEEDSSNKAKTFSKLFSFQNQFSKLIDVDSEDEEIELPAGVVKPDSWIKNAGPLKIEPKVWLANERTFNRWLHVTTLMSTLTFVVYSSSKKSNFAELSDYLAYFYFGLTLFTGLWSYYVFNQRRNIILERSGRHLDNIIGPLIVAVGLTAAMIINFVYGWRSLDLDFTNQFYTNNALHKAVHAYVASSIGI